ncbi:unnamed protein product [Durusdinium trenchii]|uniref:Secreted protein n=1 Tax=Durusdinium trenchii TaxID=1381693 RepID=A0ABP0LQ92_9DINO
MVPLRNFLCLGFAFLLSGCLCLSLSLLVLDFLHLGFLSSLQQLSCVGAASSVHSGLGFPLPALKLASLGALPLPQSTLCPDSLLLFSGKICCDLLPAILDISHIDFPTVLRASS